MLTSKYSAENILVDLYANSSHSGWFAATASFDAAAKHAQKAKLGGSVHEYNQLVQNC